MLFKKIKYVDYNGQPHEETFCFNLNKAKLMALQVKTPGGFAATIQKAVKEEDSATIVTIFTDLILKSYGEVSADGKKFVQSPELSAEFEQTAAFDALFSELTSDEKAGEEFFKGIMPAVEASK